MDSLFLIEDIFASVYMDKCKFCEIDMQIFEYDEYKLCCPDCGFIMNNYDSDNLYVSTPTGYISKPRKPEFNPNKRFAEWLNQILANTTP